MWGQRFRYSFVRRRFFAELQLLTDCLSARRRKSGDFEQIADPVSALSARLMETQGQNKRGIRVPPRSFAWPLRVWYPRTHRVPSARLRGDASASAMPMADTPPFKRPPSCRRSWRPPAGMEDLDETGKAPVRGRNGGFGMSERLSGSFSFGKRFLVPPCADRRRA